MTTGYFDHLPENELLAAFEEYQRQEIGVYGRPGLFSTAVREIERENPGKGRSIAALDLTSSV